MKLFLAQALELDFNPAIGPPAFGGGITGCRIMRTHAERLNPGRIDSPPDEIAFEEFRPEFGQFLIIPFGTDGVRIALDMNIDIRVLKRNVSQMIGNRVVLRR